MVDSPSRRASNGSPEVVNDEYTPLLKNQPVITVDTRSVRRDEEALTPATPLTDKQAEEQSPSKVGSIISVLLLGIYPPQDPPLPTIATYLYIMSMDFVADAEMQVFSLPMQTVLWSLQRAGPSAASSMTWRMQDG